MFIHDTADVKSKKIGKDTRIWQYCIIFDGAEIGENCNICSYCMIESAVKVGNNVTIKSYVQLCDGVTIEDDVLIGPHTSFTNDKYPRSKKYPEKYEKTVVKKGASIGANCVIIPGITIGENAVIAAGSIVVKDVPANTLYKNKIEIETNDIPQNFNK